MYDAIDTNNEATLPCTQVEDFVIDFLKGSQKEGEINTDASLDHEDSFQLLRDNESGEVTFDELGQFLQVLLKNQVINLQIRLEKQKYERSMEQNGVKHL